MTAVSAPTSSSLATERVGLEGVDGRGSGVRARSGSSLGSHPTDDRMLPPRPVPH